MKIEDIKLSFKDGLYKIDSFGEFNLVEAKPKKPFLVEYEELDYDDIITNDNEFLSTVKKIIFPKYFNNIILIVDGVRLSLPSVVYYSYNDIVNAINHLSNVYFNVNIARVEGENIILNPPVSYIEIPRESQLYDFFDRYIVFRKIPSQFRNKKFNVAKEGILIIKKNLMLDYMSEYDAETIKRNFKLKFLFDTIAYNLEIVNSFITDLFQYIDLDKSNKETVLNILKNLGITNSDLAKNLDDVLLKSLLQNTIRIFTEKSLFLYADRLFNNIGLKALDIKEFTQENKEYFDKETLNDILRLFYNMHLIKVGEFQFSDNSIVKFRKAKVNYGITVSDLNDITTKEGKVVFNKTNGIYYVFNNGKFIPIKDQTVYIDPNKEISQNFFLINKITSERISIEEFNNIRILSGFDLFFDSNAVPEFREFNSLSKELSFNSYAFSNNQFSFIFSNSETSLGIIIDGQYTKVDFNILLKQLGRNYLFYNEVVDFLRERGINAKAVSQRVLIESNTFGKNSNIEVVDGNNVFDFKTYRLNKLPSSISLSSGKYLVNNNIVEVNQAFAVSTSIFQDNSTIYIYLDSNGFNVVSDKQFVNSISVGEFFGNRAIGGDAMLLYSFKLINKTLYPLFVIDKQSNYRIPNYDELDKKQKLYIISFYRQKRNTAFSNENEPSANYPLYDRYGNKLSENTKKLMNSILNIVLEPTHPSVTFSDEFSRFIFQYMEYWRSAHISFLLFSILSNRLLDQYDLNRISDRLFNAIGFKDIKPATYMKKIDQNGNIERWAEIYEYLTGKDEKFFKSLKILASIHNKLTDSKDEIFASYLKFDDYSLQLLSSSPMNDYLSNEIIGTTNINPQTLIINRVFDLDFSFLLESFIDALSIHFALKPKNYRSSYTYDNFFTYSDKYVYGKYKFVGDDDRKVAYDKYNNSNNFVSVKVNNYDLSFEDYQLFVKESPLEIIINNKDQNKPNEYSFMISNYDVDVLTMINNTLINDENNDTKKVKIVYL